MSAWVLDTSAILADLVQETMSKLMQLGLPREATEAVIVSIGLNVHDVALALAIEVEVMFAVARPTG